MSQFVTTHNDTGEAVFSSKIPSRQHELTLPVGTMTLLYTTHSLPSNLSNEADIDQYAQDRTKGLPPASPCPPNGTSAALIRIAPGGATAMRRTITLGIFSVIEGQVALQLDSGETKTLQAGDVAVMRGAMHKWANETPSDGPSAGWARLMVFAQHVEPLEVNGRELKGEWA